MVMEFAELGSLIHMPNKVAEEEMDVSNLVLITIGIQVADAMMHLNTQRARLSVSCAGSKRVLVKITDYGLALLTNMGNNTGKSIIDVTTYSILELARRNRWRWNLYSGARTRTKATCGPLVFCNGKS